jgi:hypothetical protein
MITVEQAFIYAAIAGIVAMIASSAVAIYGIIQRRDRMYSLKYQEFLDQKDRVKSNLMRDRENG